jgi:hypothetical protein
MDRLVGVQPVEQTKRWDTAAHPGLGILKSESGAPQYNRIDEYLFSSRQIEHQVCHYKCLRWSMEKSEIFVFEAGEVAAIR